MTEMPEPAPDSPLTDLNDDQLGRAEFARQIAATFRDRKDRASLVIGLYGSWGEGKSSILNFVEASLSDAPEMVVVRFNPWLLRDAPTMMLAFFQTLAEAVGKRLPSARKKIAGFLRGYGTAMSAISLNLAVVSIRPGDAVRSFAEDVGATSLEKQRKGFENALADGGKRVLVLMDDLDRLDNEETHAMLQLVKLGAAFKGVSYLLALDSEKVAHSLAPRYGAADGRGGHDFLEKIVQIPLHLPRARQSDLLEIANDALGVALDASDVTFGETEMHVLQRRFGLGVAPLLRTPRAAVRFGNAISFALPLLKGEANAVDLVTLEAIRATVPELYAAVRLHPDWFLLEQKGLAILDDGRTDAYRAEIEKLLGALSPEQSDACRFLIKELFPRTARYWGEDVFLDEPGWTTGQRVADPDYFDRFFSYSVPRGQLSDEVARSFMNTGAAAAAAMRTAVGAPDFQRAALLAKVQQHIDALEPGGERQLIDALSEWGPQVTDPEARPSLLGRSLGDETARTIALLMLRVVDEERMAVADALIQTTEPLSFAADCLRAITNRPEAGLAAPVARDAAEPLKAALVERTRRLAERGEMPLWESEARGMTLLYLWAEVAGNEVFGYVNRWVEADAHHAMSLVGKVAGKAWSGPVPHQSDFDQNSLKALKLLADPDLVAAKLQERFGVEAGADYKYVSGEDDPDRVLAGQFLYLWRRDTAVTEGDTAT
jgi:hypothetical protein